MAVDGRLDNHSLVGHPGLVKAGAGPNPATSVTAEAGHVQGRCGGGVADPHFTHDQIVAGVADGSGTSIHRMDNLVRVHRRCGGEVDGRPVQVERGDRKLKSGCFAKLLIAAPPASKFQTICCVTSCGNGLTP